MEESYAVREISSFGADSAFRNHWEMYQLIKLLSQPGCKIELNYGASLNRLFGHMSGLP